MAEKADLIEPTPTDVALHLELNQPQTRNMILIANESQQERRSKKQRNDAEKLYGKKRRKVWMSTKKTGSRTVCPHDERT